jgi:ABC-type transport system involved in multi-copper enzyme maturation permease subunit
LLIGPVFTREVVTAPRRARLYVSRAAYISALLVLVCTAWLLVTGTQLVRNLGDMARFGAMLFQILAPLQLALVIFFSALLAAAAVAQEKDRRTLDLLLLTNLTNSELVLGKLLASLLNVLVMLAASLPLFMLCALFGGVAFSQIARVFAVTVATTIAAGSIGSLVALGARSGSSGWGRPPTCGPRRSVLGRRSWWRHGPRSTCRTLCPPSAAPSIFFCSLPVAWRSP